MRSLARLVIDDYTAEKYDKVVIAYTDYISTVSQQPKLRQLLPISKIDLEKQLAEMDTHAEELGLEESPMEYKVEPDARSILENILPRLVEMQIYHAVLESNASKESARMVAMRNATDAANGYGGQSDAYFQSAAPSWHHSGNCGNFSGTSGVGAVNLQLNFYEYLITL